MSDPGRLQSAIDAAAKVTAEEAGAIDRAIEVVKSPAFSDAVGVCLDCDGIIYIIGMGKSGLVGQKIAATLTSTGSPSNYIHAADALHGDLGAIRRRDIAILLSKSGETDEVLRVLQFLKSQKNKVISVTNDPGSSLGKGADVILPMMVESEGCPLNLAPMTSSTVTLALGDALAAALIVARDFRREHFARFHPGGKLGWLLTAKVSDMIGPDSNPTVKTGETLRNAVVKLVECRMGGVNIIGDEGELVGVLTDGDLKRIMISGENRPLDHAVREVMTKDPKVIHLDASAAEAIELMENRKNQLSVLPVVDSENRPVGILRLHDVIRTHL